MSEKGKSSGIDTWQEVPKKLLGFAGKLYPAYWRIDIQCPDLNSVRKWNSIDVNDLLSITKHILDIVCDNTRIVDTRSNGYISSKNLFEHDKMPLLFLIFDKYNTENKREYNVFTVGKCSNNSCRKSFDKLIVTPANFEYLVPEEKYHKFIDSDFGGFILETKNHGIVKFKPSTIGVGERVASWVDTLDEAWTTKNMDVIEIIQGMCEKFELVDDAYLRNLQTAEYNLWSKEKKAFYLTLLNQLNIGVASTLKYQCDACGTGFRSIIPYSEFNKTMFINVQSFDDELFGEHSLVNKEHVGDGN